MATSIDLHPAADRLAGRVENLPADVLDRPTPCEHFSVVALLDHVHGSVLAFRAAAVKSPLPGGPSGDAERLVADWRTRIPSDVRALADDWSHPAAWEGMTAAGGVDLPGEVAGIVGLDELVIHGWDLAKATGQPAGYEGPGLDEVLRLVTEFRGGGIEGLFGPEVPIPDDAPVLDRILGVAGRDPGWEPPVGDLR